MASATVTAAKYGVKDRVEVLMCKTRKADFDAKAVRRVQRERKCVLSRADDVRKVARMMDVDRSMLRSIWLVVVGGWFGWMDGSRQRGSRLREKWR